MSSVTLKIPMDSLMKLPSEAEFRAKDGQANVSARNENGIIVVNATCDSLQVLCEYYERQYQYYKKKCEMQEALIQTKIKEKPPNPFKAFGYGTLFGAIFATVLFIKLKKKKI